MREPQIGAIIAAWGAGKDIKIKGGDGEWHPLTPDSIHGRTSEKEWVTLREAIARFDARAAYAASGLDEFAPETLEEAVYQAIGAASMCWEDPGGAGVFDSTRAKAIGDLLLAKIRAFA